MKSLTGKFSSTRGWVVLLILLLGAGLFVAACGDEEVPTPTTPAPTPTPTPTPPAPEPEPEPVPEAPAVPVGLRISASGMDFIEWSWNAVEGVSGYDAQYSANEAFTDEDETIPRTAEEISYRREGLEAGASAFLRVRAAAGTGKERVTSDWSTHVTGMTAEPEPELPPAPAVPANLRLKESGSNFIEWEWDEVPGAAGYESQFSADGVSFSAQVPHAGVSNTSRSVANLPAERAGHLRVRSYTGSGTGADTVRGDWSASDQQTTDVPPPAVPLATPTGLDATDESDDAIALEWSSVRNADSYEVGQREPGGSWGDASCGGADNVVEDEECVASGLKEGTDYDFRVRAIPSDTDRYSTSDWSDVEEARTEGTAEPTPTTPTSGGMGDLNLRWQSDSESITWIWDRVAGETYDYVIVDSDFDDSDNPCEDQWDGQEVVSKSLATSARATVDTRGDARLMCVRTDEDENVSFSWGATTPASPSVVGGTVDPDTFRTTALDWTGIAVVGGFDWELRLVRDQGRNDGDLDGDPSNRSVQNACGTGTRIDGGTADIGLSFNYTWDGSIAHYSGYLLCLKYSNSNTTDGTEWAVPTLTGNTSAINEIHSTPAAPPAPRWESGRTATAENGDVTLEWTVPVRPPTTNVPRNATGFDQKTIHYPEYYQFDHDDDQTTDPRRTRVVHPGTAACELTHGTTNGGDQGEWIVDDVPEGDDTLGGFTLNSEAITPLDHDEERVLVRLCVRATQGSGGADLDGPWVIGGAATINKLPDPGQ